MFLDEENTEEVTSEGTEATPATEEMPAEETPATEVAAE
jgi:hypothetical protein